MEKVGPSVDEAVALCQQTLSDKGRLATAMPGFIPRAQQIELGGLIAEAIYNQTVLVAEAGTGTGKTFAYLVPCLQSGKKVLVSTATKTLQDQLFQKDLPLLIRALGLSSRVQNLKGRSNYLCQYRIQLHAEEGRFASPQAVRDWLVVKEKLPRLTHGERSELPEINEDSPVWPYVTSTIDTCLGTECTFYQTCFLVKARKRALSADVVVINHHLFFADSHLKEIGFGELLPGVGAVVFDEAHQLAEIALHFHGERLSTRQLREWMDDVLRELPVLQENSPLSDLSRTLEPIVEQWLLTWPAQQERMSWQQWRTNASFHPGWAQLVDWCETAWQWLSSVDSEHSPGLVRCKERLVEFRRLVQGFEASNAQRIQWVERFKQHVVFHATPYDVAEAFRALMARERCAYVFTSATLTMAGAFDCFMTPLGLSAARTVALPSPFDFKQQALLYLPRSLPDPKEKRYVEALVQRALPVINACGGRCFFFCLRVIVR